MEFNSWFADLGRDIIIGRSPVLQNELLQLDLVPR